MDTEHWAFNRKRDGFWLLRGIFKEYIKQNFIMAVLGKASSHSVAIAYWQKISNVKEDPRRKTDSNFDFSHAT